MIKKYVKCSIIKIKKQDKSLTTYFMEFKKVYKEFNVLLSFSPNVKDQQT